MSQVFFSFTSEDAYAAFPIIDAVKRAGFSVSHWNVVSRDASHREYLNKEIDDAQCVVALWSTAAMRSELQAEYKLALRAWSSNRLVLAVLDNAELPLGLRDLPFISLKGIGDAAAATDLIDRVRAITELTEAGVLKEKIWDAAEGKTGEGSAAKAKISAPTEVGNRPAGKSRWSSRLIIAAAGVVILAAVSFYYYPSAPPIRSSGIPSSGATSPLSPTAPTRPAAPYERHAAPAPSPQPVPAPTSSPSRVPYIAIALTALVVGLAIGALAVCGWTVWSRKRLKPIANVSIGVPLAHLPQESDGAPQVFVSYSRQDEQTVDQLVDQIKKLGYTVWIDRQSTGSQRYAAGIVHAIRASRLVALMCSAHAFTSDHVIREVYMAGDNKKPFIAFLLDPTELPDEILYFISGFPRIPIASLDREQLRSEIARLAVIS